MILLCSLLISVQSPEMPVVFRDLEEMYVRGTWRSARHDAKFLIEAYQLDESVLEAYWSDFYGLIAKQIRLQADYVSTRRFDMPEEQALREMREFLAAMPLTERNMAKMVESLLGPGSYFEQRQRFSELRAFHKAKAEQESAYRARVLRFRKSIARGIQARNGYSTPAGNPQPLLVGIEASKQAQEDANQAREAELEDRKLRQARASRDMSAGSVRRPEEDVVELEMPQAQLVMSHEDVTRKVWDAYLQHAVRGLGSEAREAALALSKAMWARGLAYRGTRAEAYAELDNYRSRVEFRKALVELDKPLVALFEEFKIRLAALKSK